MTKFGDVLTTDEVPSSGTTILNGTGPPADALGAVGNYYLDTVAKILYGPKSAPGADSIPQSAVTYTEQGTGGNQYDGMRIRPLVPGRISALRFMRNPTSGLTSRKVSLFRNDTQALLAQETTTGESGSGWRTVPLTTPVTVAAALDLRISYQEAAGGNRYYKSSLVVSGVPALVTIQGPCYADTAPFPGTDQSGLSYPIDIVFQAGTIWPIALKSAP